MNHIAQLTSNNPILVECFEDDLFHQFTNPSSQSHYEEVHKLLVEKHGEDKIKLFNKEVRKELKAKGWL